jgi:hypothetical protein
MSLKQIPLGVAYAIWSWLGTVGSVLIGVLIWRESPGPAHLIGIGLIVAGVVTLNVLAGSTDAYLLSRPAHPRPYDDRHGTPSGTRRDWTYRAYSSRLPRLVEPYPAVGVDPDPVGVEVQDVGAVGARELHELLPGPQARTAPGVEHGDQPAPEVRVPADRAHEAAFVVLHPTPDPRVDRFLRSRSSWLHGPPSAA